ncbi:hypothetical protein QLQ12_12785 [Actinoplanes sp. NEAU-A12]|uniref:Ig-like domain-containing protein n=1 Tax=Actinoplanes sandaracinus TaxID=3045177 RepID=A0ABT6WIB2_9ACTN|nr:hypothetical protein [Actinoplanes sandaracinus]MDI6099471.1 hypothetical protein [Actinoplanes sandaracinus]
MSDQNATPPAATGRRWFVAALLFMVIAAVAGGAALSRTRGTEAGTGLGPEPETSTPASAPGAALSAAAGPLPDGPASEPEPEPEPSRGTPKPPATTRAVSGTTSPAPARPVIVHFRVVSPPACPSGTDQVRHEGDPVILEWQVTGADRTTLAVDGPGHYAEYGVTGSTRVNFPCGGEPGSYQAHTYTLTAFDGDATMSKTLTVRARVQEMAAT